MRARAHKPGKVARQALAHWEKACTLSQKYSLRVTDAQHALMEMLHPEGNIDQHWVEVVNALLVDMISALTGSAGALSRRAAASGAALGARLGALGPPAAARAALMHDVRPPLMALQAVNDGANPASALLAREKRIAELLAAVCDTGAGAASVARAAAMLIQQIPETYTSLTEFGARWAADTGARRRPPAPARHGGGERNAQGAGVWRRVRLKLEARERLADQVDYIISEATNASNLCLMYEGWMAWV